MYWLLGTRPIHAWVGYRGFHVTMAERSSWGRGCMVHNSSIVRRYYHYLHFSNEGRHIPLTSSKAGMWSRQFASVCALTTLAATKKTEVSGQSPPPKRATVSCSPSETRQRCYTFSHKNGESPHYIWAEQRSSPTSHSLTYPEVPFPPLGNVLFWIQTHNHFLLE